MSCWPYWDLLRPHFCMPRTHGQSHSFSQPPWGREGGVFICACLCGCVCGCVCVDASRRYSVMYIIRRNIYLFSQNLQATGFLTLPWLACTLWLYVQFSDLPSSPPPFWILALYLQILTHPHPPPSVKQSPFYFPSLRIWLFSVLVWAELSGILPFMFFF